LKRQPEERIAASPKTKMKGEKQKGLCKRQQPLEEKRGKEENCSRQKTDKML